VGPVQRRRPDHGQLARRTAVFKQKTGNNLEFKGILAGSTKVGVSANASGNTVDVDVNEANLTLNNVGGTLGVSKGGTGQTTEVLARGTTGLGAQTAPTTGSSPTVTPAAAGIPVKVTGTLTHNSAATAFTVTHNLNTRYVAVQVYTNNAGNPDQRVVVDVAITGVNTITITFGAAQGTSLFHYVIIG
jgi:hypothetical protein